jgi:hypothetical protein
MAPAGALPEVCLPELLSQCAPIAIFAYRRTAHLARTLDALERCPEFSASPVWVFSDGAKGAGDMAEVAAARALVASRMRPNMTLIEGAQNRGLASSIIAGVNDLCDRYGRVIVIEDDLVVSPALLRWFNAALTRYADEPRVWQVSAHQFDVPAFRARKEGMFLRLSTSLGWATWKRAWANFDPSARGWETIRHDPALRAQFDLDNAYPYATMMERQVAGEVDSWAIRWWWSMFQGQALGLFPPRPLVTHTGDDETATHKPSRFARILHSSDAAVMTECPGLPDAVVQDAGAQRAISDFLRTGQRRGLRHWLSRLA